jgi:ABC transporter substrate binding protein
MFGMRRREFVALLGGAAATWPVAARGQQAERIRRIAVLAGQEKHLPRFSQTASGLGYIEGKNLAIDWRYAVRGPAQLPMLAKELVDLHPDVIVSITTPAMAAVKAATGSIPIVFAYVGDPVETGFVATSCSALSLIQLPRSVDFKRATPGMLMDSQLCNKPQCRDSGFVQSRSAQNLPK